MNRPAFRHTPLVICAAISAATIPSAHAAILVAGAAGDGSVRTFSNSGEFVSAFQPYGEAFRGGVRVATGDVNGDSIPDIITGAGHGSGPHVKVFDGRTSAVLHDFSAFDPSFTGGVFVAAGDMNSDGRADVIVGAGDGTGSPVQTGPAIRVINPVNEQPLGTFFAGTPTFTGGVSVAFGNKGPGGVGEPRVVFGAGPGGFPLIGDYTVNGQPAGSAFAYEPSFQGGVRVATGDLNGDGVPEYITAPGQGGAGHVKVFDGTNGALLRSFFAFDPGFGGGVSIAAGDVTGDAVPDIIVGELPAVQRAGPSHVKVFNGVTLLEVSSFEVDLPGGAEVAFIVPAPGTALSALTAFALLSRRRRN